MISDLLLQICCGVVLVQNYIAKLETYFRLV